MNVNILHNGNTYTINILRQGSLVDATVVDDHGDEIADMTMSARPDRAHLGGFTVQPRFNNVPGYEKYKGLGKAMLCNVIGILVQDGSLRPETPITLEASGGTCPDDFPLVPETEDEIRKQRKRLEEFPKALGNLVDDVAKRENRNPTANEMARLLCEIQNNRKLVEYYKTYGFVEIKNHGESSDMSGTIAGILNACSVPGASSSSSSSSSSSAAGAGTFLPSQIGLQTDQAFHFQPIIISSECANLLDKATGGMRFRLRLVGRGWYALVYASLRSVMKVYVLDAPIPGDGCEANLTKCPTLSTEQFLQETEMVRRAGELGIGPRVQFSQICVAVSKFHVQKFRTREIQLGMVVTDKMMLTLDEYLHLHLRDKEEARKVIMEKVNKLLDICSSEKWIAYDLHPGNLMVNVDSRRHITDLKIVDFGYFKVAETETEARQRNAKQAQELLSFLSVYFKFFDK